MDEVRVVKPRDAERFPDKVDEYHLVIESGSKFFRVLDKHGQYSMFYKIDVDVFYWTNKEWNEYSLS